MYAIKPWGNALLIGSSVGTYTLGIGMRWRESNVLIVEKKSCPRYEVMENRRCVLTEHTIKLLVDLGATEFKVRSILSPAKGWRFVDHDLNILRESCTFPGCAIGERAYHCTEGSLLRILRSEFLRFGGNIQWETRVFDTFPSTDGTNMWSVYKEYGMVNELEAIVTTANDESLIRRLIVDDPERLLVLFQEFKGVCDVSDIISLPMFDNNTSVCIIVGDGLAMHTWQMSDKQCAWRLICKPKSNITGNAHWHDDTELVNELDIGKAVRQILAVSHNKTCRLVALPATTPSIRDDLAHVRFGVFADGLLPIDPFEWRGDRCRAAIEEASTLCRSLYGKKFHRGDVPTILRSLEQDVLAKRTNLLTRDLRDAEEFLMIRPRLEEEPDEPHMPLRLSHTID